MDSSCEIGSDQTLESMLVCATKAQQQEKKARPADSQAQKCPRCDSPNTKFCYYNNYSLSQPRYFCKSCRRYWTKGGTLRNVPVGGGCRRPHKRSSSSSSSSSSSLCKRTQENPSPGITLSSSLNPNPLYDSNDLSLAFARLQNRNAHHQHQYHNEHFLGSLGLGTFLEHQPEVHSLSYGGNSLEMENMGIGGGQETERVLWGFPWMQSSVVGGGGEDVDSGGRPLSWNGIGSSNWQGLLNSPLV